jgi:hypothetical protein
LQIWAARTCTTYDGRQGVWTGVWEKRELVLQVSSSPSKPLVMWRKKRSAGLAFVVFGRDGLVFRAVYDPDFSHCSSRRVEKCSLFSSVG